MDKITIKNAKLYEKRGKFYIDVTYFRETDAEVQEIHIPKLYIPLVNSSGGLYIYTDWMDDYIGASTRKTVYCLNHFYPECGEHGLRICENDDGAPYTIRVIEKKTQEMTIEEIEKKLGYKIKVVAKK